MEPDTNRTPENPGAANGAVLSEREHEILRLVATGASNKQIAQQLVISPNTVKVHLRNIFGKIGAASRTEAALYAMRSGLVQLPGAESRPVELGTESVAPPGAAGTAVTAPAIAGQQPAAPARVGQRLWLGSLAVILIVILAAMLLARLTPAATPTQAASTNVPQWQSKSQMLTARSELAATTYADQAYASGGESATGVSGANERYDPASNTWTRLAPMPLPAADISSAAIGGLIYVPGGRLSSGEITSTLQVYDPRLDRWAQRAALPLAISGYALAVYEGKLYVFGGWTGARFVDSVFAYDPLSDQWTSHTPMPTARGFGAAASAAGKIFVMGGTAGGPPLAVNEAFSPDAEASGGTAWTTTAPIPSGRQRLSVASVADIVHVVGGEAVTGPQTALEYLPQVDQWKQIETPRPQPWSGLGLVVIGTNLYAFGGLNGATIAAQQWTYQALYTIAVPIVQ